MSTKLIWLRRVLLGAAYLTAVVIAPILIGVFNYYNKAAIPTQPMDAPAYSGALPAPPTPDPGKKIAGPAAQDIYQNVGRSESAYDATLQDLARTRHAAVAQTIASSLFYTADSALFTGAAWPVRDLTAAAALVLLGASLVFGATHIKLPHRAGLRTQPQPA